MKLNIQQSDDIVEEEITIRCGSMINDRLKRLIEQIRLYAFSVTGFKDGSTYQISLEKIWYFESVEEKTFIYCEKEIYESSLKLYEVERLLINTSFVRISKGVILNITSLLSVRPLLNGRFEARLKNNERLIINRHYVPAFKDKFGV